MYRCLTMVFTGVAKPINRSSLVVDFYCKESLAYKSTYIFIYRSMSPSSSLSTHLRFLFHFSEASYASFNNCQTNTNQGPRLRLILSIYAQMCNIYYKSQVFTKWVSEVSAQMTPQIIYFTILWKSLFLVEAKTYSCLEYSANNKQNICLLFVWLFDDHE